MCWLSTLPARYASAPARRLTRNIGTSDLWARASCAWTGVRIQPKPMPALAENAVVDGRNAHMATGLTLILPVRLPP
jgi:hypothetical protein